MDDGPGVTEEGVESTMQGAANLIEALLPGCPYLLVVGKPAQEGKDDQAVYTTFGATSLGEALELVVSALDGMVEEARSDLDLAQVMRGLGAGDETEH